MVFSIDSRRRPYNTLTLPCECVIGRNLAAINMKHKDLVHFAQLHLPATHYISSQIYFLIKLYKFALRYNKLMYVTTGIGELKSKFKTVREMIEAEDEWWEAVS